MAARAAVSTSVAREIATATKIVGAIIENREGVRTNEHPLYLLFNLLTILRAVPVDTLPLQDTRPLPLGTQPLLDTLRTLPVGTLLELLGTLPLQGKLHTQPLAGSKAHHKHLSSALAGHNTIP